MSILTELSSKCANLRAIMESKPADKKIIDKVLRLIIVLGSKKDAIKLLERNGKTHKDAVKIVKKLIVKCVENKTPLIRCSKFGCGNSQIEKCFGKVKIRISKLDGSYKNSPGHHIYSKEKMAKFLITFVRKELKGYKQKGDIPEPIVEIIKKIFILSPLKYHGFISKLKNEGYYSKKLKPVNLTQFGIVYDDEGNFKTINASVYLREYVLKKIKLIYSNKLKYYIYQKGLWKNISIEKLRKILHDLFDELLPDVWNAAIQKKYFEIINVKCYQETDMDSNTNIINMKNGTYDLVQEILLQHDEKYLSSVQLPIEYDPDAECPIFKSVLKQIMPDKATRRVMWELLGSCLSTDAKTNKAFVLYGVGSNGKSLIIKVIEMICGSENVSSVTLKDLEKPFSKALLYGKTVNCSPENENNGKPLETQHFKAIVTGDLITVENKFEKPFQFRPYCKMVFCTNNLPEFNDRSKGLKRRIMVIKFQQEFSGSNEDKNIVDKFKHELPGIFNSALRGLKRLRDNNFEFTHSQEIEDMTAEFHESNDPITSFIKDKIEAVRGVVVSNAKIRSAYKDWCERNSRPEADRKLVGTRTFWIEIFIKIRDMVAKDVERIKTNGVRGLKNLRINGYPNYSKGNFEPDDREFENIAESDEDF